MKVTVKNSATKTIGTSIIEIGTKIVIQRSLKTNQQQKNVDWQFKLDDTRVQLKTLYPKVIV